MWFWLILLSLTPDHRPQTALGLSDKRAKPEVNFDLGVHRSWSCDQIENNRVSSKGLRSLGEEMKFFKIKDVLSDKEFVVKMPFGFCSSHYLQVDVCDLVFDLGFLFTVSEARCLGDQKLYWGIRCKDYFSAVVQFGFPYRVLDLILPWSFWKRKKE